MAGLRVAATDLLGSGERVLALDRFYTQNRSASALEPGFLDDLFDEFAHGIAAHLPGEMLPTR